ncbi:MAG TPA: hypothetical protein VI911_11645 [Patescibacteria group bacterium]|nr:hypothetical protein [Patescibacteria group bacterium]
MSKTQEFKKKVLKKFPSFVESIQNLGSQDLEKNLLIYSKHREDSELAQKLDTELQSAKENVTFLAGPYRDAIGALKMKMAYINMLIREANGQSNEENDKVEEE